MRSLACLALGVIGVVALPLHTARACGGTFCDSGGPRPMPVEQTGETIVFVLDEGFVEAHIQIQYDPTTLASQFAWIVPVTAVPEFSVGSQQLVVDLLNATVPGFGVSTTWEECNWDDGGWDDDGCDEGGSGEKLDVASGGGDDETGGTEVLLQDTVGAFEVVVLQSTSAAALMTWLGDNGYYQDPVAEPILQQYVDEGFEFVAFRLTQGADVGEIHPIVLRYAGSEACVPIRLTRIAAQDDMDVRTLFLGDSRAVPTNWQHVVVNDVPLDWGSFVPNWKEAVTLAIDEADGGHAWVTEYAGTSTVVPTDALWSEAWSAAPFETILPVDVVSELAIQGLFSCTNGTCEDLHPLVRGLLRQWLPAPPGFAEDEFWSCVACFEPLVDELAWDGRAFAQALQERVIDPGAHARDVVQAHPYLTRMFTTISPPEMTEDPLFGTNPDLPEVDLRSRTANVLEQCDGRERVELPSGNVVVLAGQSEWPDIAPGEMPYATRIEELGPAGAPVVLVDNAALIQALVEAWNGMNAQPGPQRACGDDTAASDVTTDFGATLGATGGDDGRPTGCGCSTRPGDRAGFALVLLVLALRPRRPTR